MKKWKNNFLFAVIALVQLCLVFTACTDDEEISQTPVLDEYLKVAKNTLQDSIVLNATAMMGTVNKTLLEEGCPLKYYFEWSTEDTLNMQIRNFSVGKMPVHIWFSVNLKFMQLNTWEKEEYGDEDSGWIKFQGTSGVTTINSTTNEYDDGEGGAGTVTGYFNAKTNEIEFVTNFYVANMSADVYQQEIDLSRIETFDEEFAKYEEDLAQYKEDNGL